MAGLSYNWTWQNGRCGRRNWKKRWKWEDLFALKLAKNLELAKVVGAREQHRRGVEKYHAGPQINGSQWVMTNGWEHKRQGGGTSW